MFGLKKFLSKKQNRQLIKVETETEKIVSQSDNTPAPTSGTSAAEKPAYDLTKTTEISNPESLTKQDPIMKKWQSFYDLYLPSDGTSPLVPTNLNVPSFLVYKEGIHVMNAPYIEVFVSVENGIYQYSYSGGSTHMDGFSDKGVIPLEYIRNNCVVLGAILALTGNAYGFISSNQMDNYFLVDFANQSVHPPKNPVCSVCGKAIDVFTQKEHEPFCINGEIFCRRCFREINWRQVLIKDYLAIGKRGDHYYYAVGSSNIYDGDYSGHIPDTVFRDSELDISKLLTYIIAQDKDALFSARLDKAVVPYIFNVTTRKLKGDAHPCCAVCDAPLIDKNLEGNCIILSDLFYETDGKPYCPGCKANNNWATPVYTVDGFVFEDRADSYTEDYTIYLGKLNKQYVCYVYYCYLKDGYGLIKDWHNSPILLPPALITNGIIAIHKLLTFLKKQGLLKYLPNSYCDNYYSFDFRTRKLVCPVPLSCVECGIALEENNVFKGVLDSTDTLCSINNMPFCVNCFIKHHGEKAYYRRIKENMIFLFQYDIPDEDKYYYWGCDVAVLYIDPVNGKTYMDLYIKTGGTIENKIPLKQITVRAMLDKAKVFAPDIFGKYKTMNSDNWMEFVGCNKRIMSCHSNALGVMVDEEFRKPLTKKKPTHPE